MLRRDHALWAFAVILSIALLIAPALWNGFALLQWDSGGYLARWYEGYLVPSRAVVYGLMLNAGAPLAFWPVLLLQSALTIWIFALMLRAHGLGARPLLLLGIVVALSVFTTLPWLTSILLTDIFCGLSVMALYLLLLRDETLKRYERASLIALIAVSAATHNATLAVLLGILAAATLSRFVRGRLVSRSLVSATARWRWRSVVFWCLPPTLPWPSGWHGRRAASRCRSAACCRTASSRNISTRIVLLPT